MHNHSVCIARAHMSVYRSLWRLHDIVTVDLGKVMVKWNLRLVVNTGESGRVVRTSLLLVPNISSDSITANDSATLGSIP